MVGERATLDGRRQLPDSKGGLTIGSHVDIGSEVMLWTSEHDLKSETWAAIEEPIVIKDYVFIGPRAIVLPGITLGEGVGPNKKIAQQNAAQIATNNYSKEEMLSRLKGEGKNELVSD